MKKTIIVALMVLLVSTPCFAQEVEPEGIFSIEGTYWESLPTATWTIPKLPYPFYCSVGFAGGEVFLSPSVLVSGTTRTNYINMLAFSIFIIEVEPAAPTSKFGQAVGFGILQPAFGLGFMTWIGWYHEPTITLMLLSKTDDNWTPPSE